ncbi:MAG: DinB family protein [Ignavibacteriae bacterium]|nr:DinB family protein [Ignavibacteriota bacterium]
MKHCVLLLVLGSVLVVHAQETTGFRGDMMGQLEYAQGQVMQLENAIPQAKMSWRPAPGVRSIGEAYLHIATGNYFLAKFMGAQVPAAMNFASPAEADKWERSITDKKEIAEQMKKSFDFLKETITAMTDESLEKKVDFFGQQMSVRSMWLTTLSHIHEHLGQSIAYARSNGIVPPWTAAQQTPEKK